MPSIHSRLSRTVSFLLGILFASTVSSAERRIAPLILNQGGTAEKPAIFDGNGMVIDLGTDITDSPWQINGDIWTLPKLPPPNAPIMAGQYAALFIDEQPVAVPRDLEAEANQPNRKSRCYVTPSKLKPGQAGFTEEGGLYFRWPVGKLPGKSRIILPPKEGTSAVTIACSHIIVRNITAKYASNDGFNIHGKWVGVQLEDVKAFSNGDEGISAHDEVEMSVRRAEVAWNGSTAGGVADVNQCVTAYENCILHDNAGAAFHFSGKSHSATDCHIYHQEKDFSVAKGTAVTLNRIKWDREKSK
jgi:hypothetical protein